MIKEEREAHDSHDGLCSHGAWARAQNSAGMVSRTQQQCHSRPMNLSLLCDLEGDSAHGTWPLI